VVLMIGLALWLVCYCFPLMIVCCHRLLQVTTTDCSMDFLSRFFLAKPMRQQSTSYVPPQSSHLPCKIQLLCDQKLPGNGILMQKFLLNRSPILIPLEGIKIDSRFSTFFTYFFIPSKGIKHAYGPIHI